MNPRASRHSQAAQRFANLARKSAKAEEEARQQIMQKAEAEFQSQLTSTRLRIMLTQDGEDATELLAALSVVIGTPCEAAARMYGRTAEVRRLHGALRTILDMCLTHHYKWRSDAAQALDVAAEVAGGMKDQLDLATFVAAWKDSMWLANAILQQAVTKDMVAEA